MAFLRSILWLITLVLLTFIILVFFKHGPGDTTEFTDGIRQELSEISTAFRGIRESLPEAPFVVPES